MKKQNILAVCLLALLSVGFSPVFTSAQSVACLDLRSGLNIGSKNSSVTQLQDFLRAHGHLTATSTGYFGPATFKAVKAFQTKQKISAVGTVGPLTRAEIKKVSCVTLPVLQPVSTTTQPTSSTAGQVLGAQTSKISLPYIKSENFTGWNGVWGNVSINPEGKLWVRAATTTNGGKAILTDSSDWTDIKYTASVSVSNGNVILVARYKDDANFVGCHFSGNWIGIQHRVNGDLKTVAATEVKELPSATFFRKSMTVSMRVKGNTIGCTSLGNDDNVVYTKIDSSLSKGAIGVETWFEDNGSATLELHEVKVVAI